MQPSSSPVTEPSRILIIRLSALGDVVMASALLPALRRRFPHAHLAWLVEPAARDLLRHNPHLDEVIVWPRGEWRRLWRDRHYARLLKEFIQLLRRLRGQRFDLTLDLQGLLKSGLWSWLSGARQRLGLGSREGSQYLMNRVLPRPPAGGRIGAEYLLLARELALPVEDFPMDIHPGPEADEAAGVRLAGLRVGGAYALICPFTTRPQKHWFEDRWAELATRLSRDGNLTVLMLGGPGDRDASGRIRAAAGEELIDLTGQTSLTEAAALIRGAQVLIGVDTGLTHLGIAMETPTLALFGSTCPYLDPAVPRARVLYHSLPCSPCRRRPTCGGEFTCMRLHTVDEVLDQTRQLLEAP